MVVRERKIKGKVTREVVYHITSLAGKAKTYANAVRSHWSVESVPQARKGVVHEINLVAKAA